MFRLKSVLLFAVVAAPILATAQTLPPPSYAGQNYWFGPGPSALTLSSSTQDFGGYSEMYQDGSGTWTSGVSGGPAFDEFRTATNAGHPIMISDYSVRTSMTVSPYIYVDGYFGLSATLSGYGGTTWPLSLGGSRCFIVHNCPINIAAGDFGNLSNSSGTTVPLSLVLQYADYANPGSFSGSGNLPQTGAQYFSVDISPANDEGILQVDILRSAGQPVGPLTAGAYSSQDGQFIVSSV